MFKAGGGGSASVHIVSVSHCWEAAQHPDPFGSQSRRLAEELRRESRWLGLDMWCFLDYISLPQAFRNKEEQGFFQKAVASMHVLYAHRSVEKVIILEELSTEADKRAAPATIDIYYESADQKSGTGAFGPQPFDKLVLNSSPYKHRGWCVAEAQWAMLTRNQQVMKGVAPIWPARIGRRLALSRKDQDPGSLPLKFTHRFDEQIVVALHQKIFEQQAKAREHLQVFSLGPEEVCFLGEALAHFVALKDLALRGSRLGKESAAALVAGLQNLQLKEIRFDRCAMDNEAASVLARGLDPKAKEGKVIFADCEFGKKAASCLQAVHGVIVTPTPASSCCSIA